MRQDEIHIGDSVTLNGAAGIYRVIRTRNTVGILRPEDELLLQEVGDEQETRWETRAKLFLLRKANGLEQHLL